MNSHADEREGLLLSGLLVASEPVDSLPLPEPCGRVVGLKFSVKDVPSEHGDQKPVLWGYKSWFWVLKRTKLWKVAHKLSPFIQFQTM